MVLESFAGISPAIIGGVLANTRSGRRYGALPPEKPKKPKKPTNWANVTFWVSLAIFTLCVVAKLVFGIDTVLPGILFGILTAGAFLFSDIGEKKDSNDIPLKRKDQ